MNSYIKVDTFNYSDLKHLHELEPSEWGDLVPRFRYFIESAGCHPLKLTDDYKIIAVGTTILHSDTAWLATIIVHPNYRYKGIGKLLTQTLIDTIDKTKFETIYLDATELGYPVYKKVGFELETTYVHYKAIKLASTTGVIKNIIDFNPDYTEPVLQLDKDVSGENRQKVLLEHMNSSKILLLNGQLQGFYMPTFGDGCVIAKNQDAGLALMKYRFGYKENAAFPVDNTFAATYLNQLHYTPFRTSRRMYLGKHREVKLQNIYNRISGQLG